MHDVCTLHFNDTDTNNSLVETLYFVYGNKCIVHHLVTCIMFYMTEISIQEISVDRFCQHPLGKFSISFTRSGYSSVELCSSLIIRLASNRLIVDCRWIHPSSVIRSGDEYTAGRQFVALLLEISWSVISKPSVYCMDCLSVSSLQTLNVAIHVSSSTYYSKPISGRYSSKLKELDNSFSL